MNITKIEQTGRTDSNEIDVPLPKERVKKSKKEIEKIFQTVNIIVMLVIFLIISIFLLIGKRPYKSETENRNLAGFPEFSMESLLKGSYTSSLELYFNDTIPLRDSFKNITANFRSMMGFKYDDVIIYNGVNNANNDKKVDKTETTTVESTKITTDKNDDVKESDMEESTGSSETAEVTDPAPPEPEEDGILSGGILVYKHRGIPVYYGSFEKGQQYASYVNAYKADLPSVNVYSLVAPTAQSFYMPEKYASNYGSEPDNLANIRQYLNGVTEIDAYSALLPHKDEAIYSRTDHHWAPLGAYYAAKEFAAKAGVPFTDLGKYEKVVTPGYVGTLYGWSQIADLNNNPEDFIYYKPQNSYTTTYYTPDFVLDHEGPLLIQAYGSSMYCTFMGSDEFIVHVNTDVKNGKTLAIIKDSYGNAIVPFMTSSFENIYVIDMRYFNLNAVTFMREHGVTDLLFAMNTFSATGSNADSIEQIRTK